jgi:hypothetical protein
MPEALGFPKVQIWTHWCRRHCMVLLKFEYPANLQGRSYQIRYVWKLQYSWLGQVCWNAEFLLTLPLNIGTLKFSSNPTLNAFQFFYWMTLSVPPIYPLAL